MGDLKQVQIQLFSIKRDQYFIIFQGKFWNKNLQADKNFLSRKSDFKNKLEFH